MKDAEIGSLDEAGWFARDDFVSRGVAEAARAEGEELPFRDAAMSRGAQHRIDPTERGDRAAWIDPLAAPPALAELCARFEELRLELNERAWLGLTRFDVQLAHYPGGGARYARHRDAFASRGAVGPSRRATAILYLGDRWDLAHGGELRLHVAPSPVDLAPLPGRLVVFLSERIEHEVLPVHAPRWAITAWYYG